MAKKRSTGKKRSAKGTFHIGEGVGAILTASSRLLRDLRRIEAGLQNLLVDLEPLRVGNFARPLPPGFTPCDPKDNPPCLDFDIDSKPGWVRCKPTD